MSRPQEQTIRVDPLIMEKKCQIQKWRNSCYIAKDPLCYFHCPHYRRCNVNTMIIRFLTIVYISMNLLINPCSAQIRKSGNGQEDPDHREVAAGSRGGGYCLPEEYLEPVRNSFQKLIPTFNSRSFAIQLKTDLRIQIGPEDSLLVPFLRSYYTTTLSELAAEKSSLSPSEDGIFGYSAMFLYFNKEYTRFLLRFGEPLSCISYFLGVTNPQALSQLQKLTLTLQKKYLPQTDGKKGFKCLFGKSVSEQQIMNMLTLANQPTFSPDAYLTDESQDAAACEQIIFYTKDGTVMAKMPALDVERRELVIPHLSSSARLGQLEVPNEIGRYIATGLNCLDDVGQRWNFTRKVLQWMQNDLVYQIVQFPECLPGFSGILPFIMSVQKYSETFRPPELGSPVVSNFNTTFVTNSSTISKTDSQSNKATRVPTHARVRKRRSVYRDTYDTKQVARKKRQSKRHKHNDRAHGGYTQQRQVPTDSRRKQNQEQWTDQQDVIPYPNSDPRTQRNQDFSPSNPVQQNQLELGKYAEEKHKYDDELLHLYNKLNNHFEHHHMHISRLDVERAEEAPPHRFPPIVYHKTTIRPHPRRRYGPRHPTKTTVTTTTTSTTTTTTPAPRQRAPITVPVGRVKINAEVYVDENRLYKPVQVVVSGKKVNAQLHVVPKYHLSTSGEVIHVEENPDVSSNLHPNFDFNTPHHKSVKTKHILRPLNLRKHLLYRKQSRDNRPHNAVDSVLDSGFQSVTNMARSILPSVFGTPPKPLPFPKMHRFDSGSSEMHSRKGNHRLNSVDRGFKDLIETDEEIPR